MTTAHPVHQLSGSAVGPASWRWLHRAAEMAALATGSGPLMSGTAATGWTWLPRVAIRTPGTEPGSISAARKFAAMTMQRWGVADREADVAVVVSELLSNAVRHALPLAPDPPDRPIRLGLLHWGPSIMCAVADPSEQAPVPREPRWLEESGRGLHVIASLSDQWGTCPAPGQPGKVVWATFRTPY
ncbi:MAG TPA: ATP-binding protein [Streptosporangiaceae bacterium]|nr:ATP-binding protein [Streptosporangiaceae bacterium]